MFEYLSRGAMFTRDKRNCLDLFASILILRETVTVETRDGRNRETL